MRRSASFPAILAALAMICLAAAQETAGDSTYEADRLNRMTPAARAVAKVLPSVVNISTERIITQRFRRHNTVDPFSDFFNQFFGPTERHYKTSSLGSGVIIDAAGLIITNDHVVQRASRIIVTLADGTNLEATPVATDESNDLALLRINQLPEGLTLTAIEFARPNDLILGEQVITVGNPFGLGHSVASGVLSAIGRKAIFDGDVLFDDILQTDAAINPGNSGGPIVNLNGRLIGVNLAIQRDAEGIGFAIPLKRIESVVCSWMVPARFSHANLGLIPGTLAENPADCHAIVADLREDSPAAKAGLQRGDIIRAVDGHPVLQGLQVSQRIWNKTTGDTITFTLADGRSIAVTLVELPRLSDKQLIKDQLQVELQELTPRLASALKLPYSRGLVVTNLDQNSVLGRRGVIKSDVIIQAGEVPVSSLDDLALAFEHIHDGDVIELVIDRVVERGRQYFLHRYVVDIPFKR